jgi:outer membrane protein insertion porin family
MVTVVRERLLLLRDVRPLVLLRVLFLFAAAASAQDFAASDYEGRTIGRIEFDPPNQPLSRPELERLLPFQTGSMLKLAEVRAGIQKLYQTGRFSDVSIEAQLEGDAVTLLISTQLNYFVSQVIVDGAADPPNRGQLTTAAKLELGSEFAEAALEQSVENMLNRLRANGLYQSKVTYQVDRKPDTEEASIHFQVQSGDRAHFDGVQLSGEFKKSDESVIRATRWRRGFGPILFPGWRELTENRLQTGIEKLRQDFQRGDHLQARVTLEKLDYHDQANTVTPALRIDGGPIIEVRTIGAKVSAGRLRQLIPIYQERTVDRSLLVEGRRNLIEYLQSQGYFDAAVDFDERTLETDVQVIDYSIAPKGRHKLTRLEINGNRFFDSATLRERLSITPASFPRRRSGRYSEKLLERDKETILDLYRANGFREAAVTSQVVDDYLGRSGDISVSLHVEEGPQWFVTKLEIEDVPSSDADYLRSILQSTDGQPFSEAAVAADRDAALGYYYNNGYPDATFDWTQMPDSVPNRVNLRYVIRPGKREFVRAVLVRGLDSTNPTLVANRISLGPGNAISQSKISESQQKLYDLGIFAKVQTAIQNPEGEEESKNVLFQLSEASKYSFNVGFGAELARIGGGVTTFDAPAGQTAFSPRVSVGISRLNLLGLGHTVNLQTLASTFEQRALLSYTAPQFTGKENLALTFSALFDDSRDVRTFTSHRWEGSVQLAQRLSRANSVQYRFTYRRVNVDPNTLKISRELIPLLSQPDRVGVYSMSFIQDRRDDAANTHRGIYNTADAGVSLRQFGSESEFTRLLFRNATYHPLGKEVVIARTLQFGWIQRVGGVPQIPLAERFFSGGASSQRAFPDNQAGPRDLETGFPLGGNALLFHQTELRFPLIGDNVGGVLFHDMGNVYDDVRDISFRFRQNNIQDFDYMVQAAGFGIRYRTPIGPIRVDFSLSPNSPRFYGFQGTRDQLLANQGVLTNQRINVFQFHFSLGQTF